MADAVGGDEGMRAFDTFDKLRAGKLRRAVREVGRDAGRGGALRRGDAGCHFQVEVEESLEEVFFGEKP
jgi:hypothetical protein